MLGLMGEGDVVLDGWTVRMRLMVAKILVIFFFSLPLIPRRSLRLSFRLTST